MTFHLRFLLFFFFLKIAVFHSQSAYENIQIPPVKSAYPYDACEPAIAIHPHNQNWMAAGTVLQGYHFSKDGGKTWKSKNLKSPFGVYGDPVLSFDSKGRLYYFHLSNVPKGVYLDRIVCQYSDNISGKFSKGSFPAPNGKKAQDKHWVVIDPKTDVIYMTWTQFDAYDSKNKADSSLIMFSKSMDRGLTWTNPLRISKFGGDCLDDDNTVEGATPALGINGEIYVTWSGPKGLMFQVSKDDGNTWLEEERKILDHVGGWSIDIPGIYRANGLPFLVSDLSSGPNRGNLYLNWCDQRKGENDTDVWLKISKDGGETWSADIRVNQDDSQTQQFFTHFTVDQSSGDLHFVFYDRSPFKEKSVQTNVAWVQSKDGGQTFKQETISNSPFVPSPAIFFGDYLNIAAVNGVVRPIWPRMDEGKITLWTALIQLK